VRGGRTHALVADAGRRGECLDAVLLPGLVNAHSHLDLGGSTRLPAGADFPSWLLAVGGVRQSGRDPAAAAQVEAGQLAARGVVAVGDIDGSHGAGTLGRRRSALGGRSYLEIVGVDAAAARARLAASLALVDRLGEGAGGLGLSPHAPYSVHGDVLSEIVRAARARRLPLAMHLAESEAETRYLLHGDGPFVDFLERIGRGRPFASPPGLRPIAYAERIGLLAAGGVVIHGNDLSDDDVQLLARHTAPVVYCHGTHRHFGRPPHRLLDLHAAGVPIAFGTDSSASNERVDLFDELCRLRRDRPDVDGLLLLQGATRGGRRALQLDEGPAHFVVGSAADGLLLGPLPGEEVLADAATLADWAFSGDAPVFATLAAGVPRTQGAQPPAALCAQLDSLRRQG